MIVASIITTALLVGIARDTTKTQLKEKQRKEIIEKQERLSKFRSGGAYE